MASLPKYVASNTLTGELGWKGTLLEGTLDDVKRFDSGVVLLTYLPAS